MTDQEMEAEIRRRQEQVLNSEGFAKDFAECLAAQKRGDKPTHSKDLKRKYKKESK